MNSGVDTNVLDEFLLIHVHLLWITNERVFLLSCPEQYEYGYCNNFSVVGDNSVA
jgi:hypothetical protein